MDENTSFSLEEYEGTPSSIYNINSDSCASDSDEFSNSSDTSELFESDGFEGTDDEKEDFLEEENIVQTSDESYKKENYIGLPFLNKFERARVIGIRAEQINSGSKIFIITKETDPIKIAKEELDRKRMPLIIRRYFGKTHVDISVNELKQIQFNLQIMLIIFLLFLFQRGKRFQLFKKYWL